jgi:hypothetical protein
MNMKESGRKPPNLGRIPAFTGEDYENLKISRPGIWFALKDITVGLSQYKAWLLDITPPYSCLPVKTNSTYSVFH